MESHRYAKTWGWGHGTGSSSRMPFQIGTAYFTRQEEAMQTLVAYVENKPGVLNRVSSLARRLAINIDSLTVGPTDNEEIARMTIVAHTDRAGPTVWKPAWRNSSMCC